MHIGIKTHMLLFTMRRRQGGKRGGEREKGKEIDIIVLGKIYLFLEISFHIFRAFILLRIISFT